MKLLVLVQLDILVIQINITNLWKTQENKEIICTYITL